MQSHQLIMADDEIFLLPENRPRYIKNNKSNSNDRQSLLRCFKQLKWGKVKRNISEFVISTSTTCTTRWKILLSKRCSRKIAFLLFISVSFYALISSEVGEVPSSRERNPYHGFTPTYEKATTEVKSQGMHDYHKMDNQNYADTDKSAESSIILPEHFRNIADISDFPASKNDVPFYFHIPRSGGLTIKNIMEICLGLVGASIDSIEPSDRYLNHTSELDEISFGDRSQFVNVQTTTSQGINLTKKKESKLTRNNFPDYVVTQHLHTAAGLFNVHHQGRLFTIMRDPVERIVSLFYDLSIADLGSTNVSSPPPKMSIEMWAKSDNNRTEFNWMTRYLSNNLESELTPHDLHVAKEILRKKCLVGFLEAKSESVMRLQKYFHWEINDSESRECFGRFLDWGWSNKNSHPMIEINSPTYKMLEEKNSYDMDLYEYSRRLFELQSKLFENEK